MHKEPSLLVALGLVGITATSGVALMAPRSSAVSSDLKATTASVTVAATCSMTANVESEHVATLINGMYSGNSGSYPNGIGKTTISVLCNDAAGYSIYAIGFTNNTIGNNRLVNPALSSSYSIMSGTATSGDTSNWSMKVERVTGNGQTPPTLTDYFKDQSGNGKYVVVPSQSYQKVAYYGSNVDAVTQSSSITTTYAAYISADQPAGTYSGQVAYMLVHPSTSAVYDNIKIMQNIAQWKTDLNVGDEVTAIDSRDGKTYTVARLCVKKNTNGACTESQYWMTQNLDFTIDPNKTYTHADTDLGWTTGDNGATWKPSSTLTTAATLTATGGTTVQNWGGNVNTPHQADFGDVYSVRGTRYNSLDACKDAGNSAETCAHYHVGNYYDWPAATANNNASGYVDKYTVASNSICPAGWRLPNGPTDTDGDDTADTPSEFNQLFYAQGITNNLTDHTGTNVNVGFATNGLTNLEKAPLYFARSGYVNGSTLGNFGSYGAYWSSTVVDGNFAYYLYYYSGYLYPASQNYRYYGRSVRCVAR